MYIDAYVYVYIYIHIRLIHRHLVSRSDLNLVKILFLTLPETSGCCTPRRSTSRKIPSTVNHRTGSLKPNATCLSRKE